jgi:histidinol-phosphatase (PHP family)
LGYRKDLRPLIAAGRMERTCAQAVQIGLRALISTEHLDFTGWTAEPEDFLKHVGPLHNEDGLTEPPLMDVEGYYRSIERCRRLFRELRIPTGIELGRPHLDAETVAAHLDLAALDRVNGSLPTLPLSGRPQ